MKQQYLTFQPLGLKQHKQTAAVFLRFKEVIFVKGIGGPYFHHYGGDGFEGSFSYKYSLMYASINQQISVKKEHILSAPIARPNPTKGKIFISEDINGNDYMISNLMGEVLVSGKPEGATLDVVALPSGVYMLTIKAINGELYRQRIIKI